MIIGKKEILKTAQSDGFFTYSEINTKTYETATSFFGWRVVLFLMRWKVWTINVFFALINNLFSG